MSDQQPDLHTRVVSGETWAEFCDQLKAAGDLIQEKSETDLDRAEGYRFLSRLLRGGLTSCMETGAARYPLISTMPYNVKIGSDNPDSLYQTSPIDGRCDYRVTGSRGTVHYLSFSAFSGNYGAGRDRLGVMGFIDGGDLLIDDATGSSSSSGRPRTTTTGSRPGPSRACSPSASSSSTATTRHRPTCGSSASTTTTFPVRSPPRRSASSSGPR